MLKVTYTEAGLHLESLSQALEEWIACRIVFALRTSQRLVIEPGSASILIAKSTTNLSILNAMLQETDSITFSVCDSEYVEVSLQGTCLTSDFAGTEGIFVADLSPKTETMLLQLWQASVTQTSPLWR